MKLFIKNIIPKISFWGLAILFIASFLIINGTKPVYATSEGSCGPNISWSLSNGKLSIEGTGNMTDFRESTMAPWYEKRVEITSVVISEGITSIGELAFYHCENLERVQLPDSIQEINELSFAGCTKLKTVFLGDEVESIGAHAFEGCSALQMINLPVGLLEIGYQAFCRCESLTSIKIPYTVYSLGESVFAYCINLVQAHIEAPIAVLPAWTFYGCDSLVTVSLPASVESVDTNAFKGCDSLNNTYHENADSYKETVDSQIKQDVADFEGIQGAPSNGITNSEWTGTESKDDGSVTETTKDVSETENSTIQTTVEHSKPSDNSSENYNVVIDATVKTEAGWKEVISKVNEVADYPERLGDKDTTVDDVVVNIQLKEDVVLDVSTIEDLIGKSIHLNINTAEGTAWSIRCEDLEASGLSGEYDLTFTLVPNENPDAKQQELLGDATSFLLSFENEIPFKFTVKIPLSLEYARQYATLYQKPILNDWSKVQTVVIDYDGYACFNLEYVDHRTEYMIGINVANEAIEGAIVPESMYEQYGTLTDEDGVHYELTGVESSWGISFRQVTYIMIGVIIGSVVIVAVVMKLIMRTPKNKNKYKQQSEVTKEGQ